jgi:hypothetical protein
LENRHKQEQMHLDKTVDFDEVLLEFSDFLMSDAAMTWIDWGQSVSQLGGGDMQAIWQSAGALWERWLSTPKVHKSAQERPMEQGQQDS